MRATSLFGWICVACGLGAAATVTASAQTVLPKERLVKAISLQHFFNTAHPLRVDIYQAAQPKFRAGVSVYPLRVCFVQPPIVQEGPTVCTQLGIPGEEYQEFDSAELRLLPGTATHPGRPALVIHATASVGPSGPDEVHGLFVWTSDGVRPGPTFRSSVGVSGEQEFMKQGPLRGAFIEVSQVGTGGKGTMLSPQHYQVTVYEPYSFGYVKVLTFLSKRSYVNDEGGDGMQGTEAIDLLTPEIVYAMEAIYPSGVYAHAVRW